MLTSQKIDDLLKFVGTLPTTSSIRQYSSDSKENESNTTNKQIKKEKFYITTAINYTNGIPHIGHAYEALTTDIIARYHRIYGRDVFFLTGTDEHGQKVANTAEKHGLKPKQLCDKNVAVFKELNVKLRISNDRYIRTTDSDHYKVAQKMFTIAYENGDIYLSKYEGWYNVREEQYVTETEAKKNNYIDPVSKEKYSRNSEESYFFKMSKYQKRLLEHIKSNPSCIQPSSSYQLILRRLESETLTDLCVSRSTFDWGVPVPIDDCGHVIYVWFDALSNYLTGIDYFGTQNENKNNKNMSSYWPANVHIIGKDISWFHCVIWPCILMSCNIALPKAVFCHGFVTDAKGEKMSKSIGNVVDPFSVLKRQGFDSDTIRYFIASQARYGDDLRWNSSDLDVKHDAHLANIYGNLVNRALVLCSKFCESKVSDCVDCSDEVFSISKLRNECELAFSNFDLLSASVCVMNALRECNDWLAKKEPWKVSNISIRNGIVRRILECIYVLAHFMEPFTPRASQQVFSDLNHSRKCILELNGFDNLENGKCVNVGKVLFERHSSKFVKQKQNENKPVIARLDFRVGQFIKIDSHPKSPHLYVSEIDIGESKPRQIVSGLVEHYPNPNADLLDKKCVVFANLKYSKFKSVLSQGMVMCAKNNDGRVCILGVPNDCKVGERVNWQKVDLNEWDADRNVNISKKNSFWKSEVAPKLRTDANGNMCFDGIPFITKSIKRFINSENKNAQIS